MILTDQQILVSMNEGLIKVEPYRHECLGTNSYDVHLGKTLGIYVDSVLDAKKHNKVEIFEIPEDELSLRETIRELMQNVVRLSVPLTVDLKQGRNWAEMS